MTDILCDISMCNSVCYSNLLQFLSSLDLGCPIFELTGVSLSVESTDKVILTRKSRMNFTLIFRARNLNDHHLEGLLILEVPGS